MQAVSTSDATKVNSLEAVTLYLAKYGQTPYDVGVVSCRYTSRVSSGDDFTFGNASSASVSLTLDATQRLGIKGTLIQVLWSVDTTRYPLFTGYVTTERLEGGALVIEANDAIYALGGKTAAPTGSESTAKACLETIAAQMSLTLDSATQSAAKNLTLSFSNLPERATCAQALAMIAGCLGGNAVITRDGLLAVRRYARVDYSAESYSGGDTTESDGFTLTGFTFVRTETDAEGNVTEHKYAAGDGSLELENDIATQTAATLAWGYLNGLSFAPGSFSIPGGLLLECGDLVTLNDLTVACMDISMDIDGGVKTTVSAYGEEDTGGATGSLNQRVDSALAGVTNVQQQITQERKDREDALADLNDQLSEASGLYSTEETLDDGSVITYLHNRSELTDSTLVVKINSGGIGISNDGGVTYQYGFTFDGTAILEQLYVTGISGVSITMENGNIGKFEMSEGVMSVTYTHSYAYLTLDDEYHARAYLEGTRTLSDDEFLRCDVNMDGAVTSDDLIDITHFLTDETFPDYSVYKVTLDPSVRNGCLTIEITDGYRAGTKTAIGAGGVNAGSLNISGAPVKDFVVETGTDGIWTYEKWHSGKAVCWGKQTYASHSTTAAWGSLYISDNALSESFPDGLFADTPDTLEISFLGATTGGAFIQRGPDGSGRIADFSATSTGPFWFVRATSYTMTNVAVGFHAIGRWK